MASRRVAAVTMAYNEPYFLHLWVEHYARSLPRDQLYVVDHGSDDGSTQGLGGVNVVRIPRSPMHDGKRAKFMSEFCSALLECYDVVIHTEADELLVPDPEAAPDLQAYCDGVEAEAVTAIGLNVEQVAEDAPLAPGAPLLRQRGWARLALAMCKPVLTRVPIRWDAGFHISDQAMEFDRLFLFHLRHHDLPTALQRLGKTQAMPWGDDPADHDQRWDDGRYVAMQRASAATDRQITADFREHDPDIRPWLDEARDFAKERPQERRRFYMTLSAGPPKLLRVPDRFRDALPAPGPALAARARHTPPLPGQASSGGEVTAGHDGWLFLTGGSNDVLRLFHEPGFLEEAEIAAWLDLLAERGRRCAEAGMTFRHLFAPDKLSIYPEMFAPPPPGAPPGGPAARILAAARARGMEGMLVDAEAALLRAKGGKDLFLRTDSHWSFEGCLAAYAALCTSLGVAPRLGLRDRPSSRATLALDLGAKMDPPMVESAAFHRMLLNGKRVEANALVEELEATGFRDAAGLLGGSRVVFRNASPRAEDATLVLFGDSFSEFRPHLLTGMLAETFREVHFLWSASVDHAYARDAGADIVVSEIAERFVKRLPDDGRDLRAVARERLEARRRAMAPARESDAHAG